MPILYKFNQMHLQITGMYLKPNDDYTQEMIWGKLVPCILSIAMVIENFSTIPAGTLNKSYACY